jgi:Dolichyl-phosphate-mannose-protein mannosyltransferase
MRRLTFFERTSIHLAKTDIINVLLIIFLWIIMSVLVNPLGDFPLNDDWVYGRAAQSILEKGGFTLAGGNTSANLIAQSFLGALFCLPFGFSFFALRISTLTMGLIGVLASYGLLREIGADRKTSFFGSLLIALNPIYFGLSNTFMTDIPFFALTIMSLYFLVRGLNHNRKVEVIIGILLSYLSLFVRQNGIIIPVAFGCAYLVKKGWSKTNIAIAFAPTLFGACLQFTYQRWLELTDRASPNFNLQAKGLSEILFSGHIETIIRSLAENTVVALIYVGLFISPLIIPIFMEEFRALSSARKKIVSFAILMLFTLMIIYPIKKPKIMPMSENILTHFGLGPLTLHDTFILSINYPSNPIILKCIWTALTVIGVLSAALLIYYFLVNIINIIKIIKTFQQPETTRTFNQSWLKVLVVLSIGFYFLPMGIVGFFDRYLLVLIPLSMAVVVISKPPAIQLYAINTKTISVVLSIALICGGLSVGATHDYLAWNRVRWHALNSLMNNKKILPNYIDGGYEFNGWYLYDPKNTYAINFQPNPKEPNKSWWYVDKDDYLIAFGPVNNYELLERYPTGRWLPLGPENIFVLKKYNR